MKQLYDYSQLQSVLKGFEYLSDARVEMYDKHKEDLILLKKVYKNNLSQEKYNIMFRSSEDGTYSAYCKYRSHRIVSPYRSINHQLQKSEAFQSVHHVTFILCYNVLSVFSWFPLPLRSVQSGYPPDVLHPCICPYQSS